MRLCILIMGRTNPHNLSAEKEGARWRMGEIVDIFDADERGMTLTEGQHLAGNNAFYAVFVTDWPRTLEDAKARVLKTHRQDDDDEGEMVARRKFFFRPADLPPAVRTKLQNDRAIEVTTAQVKNFINKRRLNSRTLYDQDGSDLD